MANELTVPDVFKTSKPAQAFVEAGPVESLSEGIGSSYAVIGYKGKTWSLRYKGNTHNFMRQEADGTQSPSGHIDVVILRQAHTKSKSFYDQYVPGQSEGKRPICSSIDGIVPDSDVATPQANACAICPKNVLKTDATGRKMKDCTDYKRLAVLVVPSMTQAILGSPLIEPVFLRVPPASLNNLSVMGETMASQGWPFHSFVCRITFDPDQPHPKMVFRPISKLEDADAAAINELRKDLVSTRITGEDQMDQPRLAPPPAQPALAAPVQRPLAPVSTVAPQQPTLAPAVAPPPQPLAIPTQPATPTTTGLGIAPTASPSNVTIIPPSGNPAPVGLGLKDVTPRAPVAAAPVAQTVADVGEPTESDAELDARVRALIGTPKSA